MVMYHTSRAYELNPQTFAFYEQSMFTVSFLIGKSNTIGLLVTLHVLFTLLAFTCKVFTLVFWYHPYPSWMWP